MRAWVNAAQLVRTRNLKGSFVVRATAGLPFLLTEGTNVAFVPPRTDAPRSASVSSVSAMNGDTAEVRFSGIEDPDTARLLVGCHVLVSRSLIGSRGLLAASPLFVGWTVFDGAAIVGTVSDVRENPAQTLLEVACGEGRYALVPLVEDLIVEMDESKQILVMDLPVGLLDLGV